MQAVINNFVRCLRLLDLRHKINYVDTLNNYVVCSIIKARKAFASYRTTKVHFCLIFSLTVTNTTTSATTTIATILQMNNNNNNNDDVTSWGHFAWLGVGTWRHATPSIELYALHAYDPHLVTATPTTQIHIPTHTHTYTYTHTHVWNGHFWWGERNCNCIGACIAVAQFAKAS